MEKEKLEEKIVLKSQTRRFIPAAIKADNPRVYLAHLINLFYERVLKRASSK